MVEWTTPHWWLERSDFVLLNCQFHESVFFVLDEPVPFVAHFDGTCSHASETALPYCFGASASGLSTASAA
jgi:hypothetical protein